MKRAWRRRPPLVATFSVIALPLSAHAGRPPSGVAQPTGRNPVALVPTAQANLPAPPDRAANVNVAPLAQSNVAVARTRVSTPRARIALRRAHLAHGARAHSAADPALTIADFHFTPSAVTVHVGDTITWTNNGPSTHTATARDGSFNTGPLKQGQSASHTFIHAGTFAYFCQIHPFMHGTIVVLAAPAAPPAPTSSGSGAGRSTEAATTPSTSGGSGTGGSSGSATRPPSTPTRAAAQPALPVTGLDLSPGLAIGLVLLGAGVALHRATRERPG